jgi:spoIIIJ-associated protein
MAKEHIASAPTVDEAIEIALEALEAARDEVEILVLEEPGRKLFGGSKEALVKVSVKENDEEINEGQISEDEAKAHTDTHESFEERLDGDRPHQSSDYDPELDNLSNEEIDAIADAGIENLKKLVAFLHDGEIAIEEFEGDDGEIILDISGDNIGVLIGRHGRTIDALQVAVSAITTKQMGVRYPLSVDVEGYKYRRKQKVIDIAKHAAERAKRTSRSVSLKSMTPLERRIVHMTLRDVEGVTTTSEGNGPYRHVVVLPA